MKWVELIQVRSSKESLTEGMPLIVELVQQIHETTRVKDAIVLQHALYDGDLSVVLTWNNERQPVRTREGLVLVELLERYGMVDHGVWHAAPGFEESMESCRHCGCQPATDEGGEACA